MALSGNILMMLSGVTPAELSEIEDKIKYFGEQQQYNFAALYMGRRRKPQDLLICALLGLFGLAGIQRFLVGDILLGVLFLLTGGFCYIGTIIDLVNHQSLAFEYNRKQILETATMVSYSAR